MRSRLGKFGQAHVNDHSLCTADTDYLLRQKLVYPGTDVVSALGAPLGSISISIVSHGHGVMVEQLVADLLNCPDVGQIVVTCNIPESMTMPLDARIQVVGNAIPAGFAANQNAAFRHCILPYFCPLNPDM